MTPITATVVLVRHPDDVAASLASRNGFAPATSVCLWLRYLLAATANDPHHLVVDHQAFFDALPAVTGDLARHLGLPEPDAATLASIRSHLDDGLHHHRTHAATPADNPIVALGRAVWNDGAIDLGAIDPLTAAAVRDGWLRPPADGEALTQARAQVVELTERLRRRKRERLAAADGDR